MAIKIVSYSLNGNNGKLSRFLAQKMQAELIELQEKKKRTFGSTILDFIFNRTPQPLNIPNLNPEDEVLFVGPIWGGNPCLVFKKMFLEIQSSHRNYSYIGVAGGDLAQNPKVKARLVKLTGKEPKFVALYAMEKVAERKLEQAEIMKIVIDDAHLEKLAQQIANSYPK